MLNFRPGVRALWWSQHLSTVLELACAWSAVARVDVDVNSIDDKQHGVGTLHGWGLAVDLDTVGDKPADLASLHGFLARYLPPAYDVVLEATHVHVEFDMKRKAGGTPPV